MSYDLEIFDGNPEASEDNFRPLDCRLAWNSLQELLVRERTERDHDEMVWFLPTRTVSLYLGHEDETVPSMAASLVWGDRSREDLDLTAPPEGDDVQMRADLTKIFITLQSLAEKLGARLYDPQHEDFVERAEISRFVEEFNHDDLVRRIAQGEHITMPGAEPLQQRTTDESERYGLSSYLRFKPATILAVLVVIGLIGMKISNRVDRHEARNGEISTQRVVPEATAPRTSEMPSAELWVDANYTVHRSALQPAEGTRMLTWVIQSNGQTVLERNAENETQYSLARFVSGSVVTVYLKAWVNGGYHTVSNVVTFKVP